MRSDHSSRGLIRLVGDRETFGWCFAAKDIESRFVENFDSPPVDFHSEAPKS